MKVAVGDERIFEEVKKIGKAVLVLKNGKNECCARIGESLQITADTRNLREALECLADLGFDFAILKGFEVEIEGLEKGIGSKIPKVTRLEDLVDAPEIETIKSVVEKVKRENLDCGAIAVFVGVARGFSDGRKVKMLEYEAYREILAEKIAELESKVKMFPGIKNVKVFHKLGKIMPGEDIVYIAVTGKHRSDVWAPLIFAVELMKSDLPIWKKEIFEDGERWV